MNDPDRLGDWFGRFIHAATAPPAKSPRARRQPSRIEVEWDLGQGGAAAAPPVVARSAWRSAGKDALLFVGGQACADARDATRSAGRRHAASTAPRYASLSQAGRDARLLALVRRRATTECCTTRTSEPP